MGIELEIIYVSPNQHPATHVADFTQGGEGVQAAVLLDLERAALQVQAVSVAAEWFPAREQARLALGVTLRQVPTPTGTNQLLDAVAPAARAAVAATQVYWDPSEGAQVGYTPGEAVTGLYEAVEQAEDGDTVPAVRLVPFDEWRAGSEMEALAERVGWPWNADLDDSDLQRLSVAIQEYVDRSYEPGSDYTLLIEVVPALQRARGALRESVREDLRHMRERRDYLDLGLRQEVQRIYLWGEDSQYQLADWTGWSQRHIGRITHGKYVSEGPAGSA